MAGVGLHGRGVPGGGDRRRRQWVGDSMGMDACGGRMMEGLPAAVWKLGVRKCRNSCDGGMCDTEEGDVVEYKKGGWMNKTAS